jgi:cold shock CspA family protein
MVQLYKGKLEEWDDKEGFGVVKSVHNRRDLYIHISSFAKNELTPLVGDMIEYNIIRNKDGQDEAIKAKILPRIEYKEPKKKSGAVLYTFIAILLLSIGGVSAGYYMELYKSDMFKEYFPDIAKELNPPKVQNKFVDKVKEPTVEKIDDTPKYVNIDFSCDGKTQCSQMVSCGEALYYITNCPNTDKLDKDSDGIPCEAQLCGDVDIDENAIAVSAPNVKDMYTPSNDLKCDGRTRCSQMTSCEEATYFLHNCPNTKMDGDANGVPCERQWCGS